MIRVMIVDDQALIRESLEMILALKEGIEVVAVARDGKEAIEMAEERKPDVILMDVRLPGMNGVECVEIIRARTPAVNVIVLSTFDDDEYVFRALRSGARGYLLKTIPIEELVSAIRTVASGGALMNPSVAARVLGRFARSPGDEPLRRESIASEDPENAAARRSLNRSEAAIVRLIGGGLSNKEITARLNLSEGTVRNYISGILSTLGLRDRTQIAIWAVRHGMGSNGDSGKEEGAS
jgi:DNA-binding NarL/FixJ family response regulator